MASFQKFTNLNYCQTRNLRLYKTQTMRLMYHRGRAFDVVQYNDKTRSSRIEWNLSSELFAFAKRLNEDLSMNSLKSIFTTQSYIDNLISEQQRVDLPRVQLQLTSNSDLITQGRSLIEIYIKSYLRFTFNSLPEEGITEIFQYLSSHKVLSDISLWIGSKDLIQTTNTLPNEEEMANIVLALIAAIKNESGSERAQRFVVDIIISYLHDKNILDDVWKIPNPRETLNLILSNSKLPSYEPRIMYQVGQKSIEQCFIVGLYVDKKYIGSNAGETLDIAEECAALDALQRLFGLKEYNQPMQYGESIKDINFGAYNTKNKAINEYTFS